MSYKESQQMARDGRRRVIDLFEGDKASLYNDDGKLNLEGLMTLREASMHPMEHKTVDLGIKAFKRFLRGIPMMTKSIFNQQVAEYKEKARQDYRELVNFKGSFPTMPA